MYTTNEPNQNADLLVERLFKANSPVAGQRCQNPVTGGWYMGKLDPIAPQKRDARRALLAREWFKVCGPEDAQPLPLSSEEIEDMKYAWDSKHPALSYIKSRFAFSLQAHGYDFNSHPSFEDFACGVTASEHAPDHVKKDEELRKRYPPRPLLGLNAGNCWEPPKHDKPGYRRTRARAAS
jgi:hypothetical protein